MSGYAYLGREACGCVTCVTLDAPTHKREVAKDVAQWLRWGMTVERVTVEAARQAWAVCEHKKARASALAADRAAPTAGERRSAASGGAQGPSFGEVANGTGAFDSTGGRRG